MAVRAALARGLLQAGGFFFFFFFLLLLLLLVLLFCAFIVCFSDLKN